ncbi:leucine-rich repeat domain-containing protein [Treponema sp. OMZ 788]|uniref:leucine-rich repeat domain-containing protein n=1 Tax=Treponema sp. OMZ 788 TaxID=2563664 RepID=UPI0020A23DFA|nr:leucine-rich repeat domain-containing protein [Treponema sp. OMZ 788]UTC65349.1 leucine-rich repeat domain-containing protein [Treponema sp. OMZ 788]
MKQIKTLLTAEEKVNLQLLEITDGMLTRVTDSNKLIGSLVLPDSVTEIGRRAFYCCTGLTSVRIPNSITVIAKSAFYGCTRLTKLIVDIENPVYCSEKNIIYTKDKKKLIAAAAGLEHIVIPGSVTDIGGWGFFDCTRLTHLSVDSENPVYCSEKNIIYTKDKKKLIAAASGLKSVIIADGVTEIPSLGFSACSNLTDVVIPNTVTEIGESAFLDCSKLKTVIIDSVILMNIEDSAFENVNADVHFTVKTDAVKALLKKSSSIRDEQITVAQVCG